MIWSTGTDFGHREVGFFVIDVEIATFLSERFSTHPGKESIGEQKGYVLEYA